MAYQNVGTPRFYVNVLEWLETVGFFATTGAAIEKNFRTLPVEPILYGGGYAYDIPNILGTENFIAVLGHQLATDNINYAMANWGGSEGGIGDLINGTPASGYDGFSISLFSSQLIGNLGTPWIAPQFYGADTGDFQASNIGSVVVGTYYDMPHSPELNLTMSREMDGFERVRTKGGNDLINYKYTKPAMWNGVGAWELHDGTPTTPKLSRTGRRVWDLSFQYLQDSDVFGPNQLMGSEAYTQDGYGDDVNDGNFDENILTNDNFYSQVIHRTNGG